MKVLEKLFECKPRPYEIFVYKDDSDNKSAEIIIEKHPSVKLLNEPIRVGPGGARHRCISAASQPYFASFDDDSWPIDKDYFSTCINIMEQNNNVAVLEASIFHQNQKEPERINSYSPACSFTGCGHVMRVSAYRQVSGYVDRPWAYGIEERDVAMQLIASGWKIIKTSMARVFHDTNLKHHGRREITKATIENAALLPWLRYPALYWPYGVLQFANVIWFLVKSRRYSGLVEGILNSPVEIWRYRKMRKPISYIGLKTYLTKRRA